MHTSTVSVAVYPQPSSVSRSDLSIIKTVLLLNLFNSIICVLKTNFIDFQVDVQINDEDVKFETKTARGPGGQHVNKIQTAVRLHHLPTGK